MCTFAGSPCSLPSSTIPASSAIIIMDTTRNTSTSSSSRALHVVMCPWLAFGHMLPYLDLSERLASHGHRVTFVSTPRNIERLPPAREAMLSFVALPLPQVDGLPDGAESTHDVSEDKKELLWKAFDGLAAPFAEFFSTAAKGGARPDCIIFDIFHYWAAATAREYKVPGVMFQHCSAKNVAAWDRQWREKQACKATKADGNDVAAVHGRQHEAPPPCTSAMTADQRRYMTLELCTLAAMSSCQEWEPELVPFVETLGGKTVVPLGLMAPRSHQGRRRHVANGEEGNDDDVTLRWLDAQPANSVVYIALGTEVPLGMEQVRELAFGLELAGTRFLWALRMPRGGITGKEDILPPGFQERTHDRGFITFSWVPQISILAHGALGAFLTHCGWNSVVEGPLFGRPLIMLPIAWEQWSNARLMEGKKVGVQVPRDEKDRSRFSRDGVASAVRIVMTEVESRMVFTESAKKLQAILSDRELQERYMDGFIQQLMNKEYSFIQQLTS